MTDSAQHQLPWLALKVKGRSEPAAEAALRSKGFRPFVPRYRERRKYCDRFKVVEGPMFPGYLFCPMAPEHTVAVLSIPAVQYIVGNSRGPTPVEDQEIASLRQAESAGAVPVAFVRTGCRVRVRFGTLQGVEGILVRGGSAARLVLSVEMLSQSVSVEVDEDQIEFL